MTVQHLPKPETDLEGNSLPRVESGAIRFGKDWNSLHLRGDDAFALAQSINVVLKLVQDKPRYDDVTVEIALNFLRSIQELIKNDVVMHSTSSTPSVSPDPNLPV